VKTQLIMPAAGMGLRLGSSRPKALAELCGLPLIVRTLTRFREAGQLEDAIVPAPASQLPQFEKLLAKHFPGVSIQVLAGGSSRQESVRIGLEALGAQTEIVLIHDAARPFVPVDAIHASIQAAADHGAATVAVPAIDTILLGDTNAFLESTPDRARTWACQTPQTFQAAVIREAHTRARADGFKGTDDASLVRRLGKPVKLVMGVRLNFKLTTPEDLAYARMLIQEGLA